jgi:hypothetical protein
VDYSEKGGWFTLQTHIDQVNYSDTSNSLSRRLWSRRHAVVQYNSLIRLSCFRDWDLFTDVGLTFVVLVLAFGSVCA